jgi:molecular chaperone GrpE
MDLYIFKNEQSLLPPNDLEAEIISLQEELMNEREQNVRALANFKNYRRRTELDEKKISMKSKREMIFALIDIIDDMDKVLQCANDTVLLSMEEVQNIHKKLFKLLEMYGVLPFKCVGTPFNHILHEAMAMAAHEGSEPRTVVDELRRGYLWNNELLRPAQVRVSG